MGAFAEGLRCCADLLKRSMAPQLLNLFTSQPNGVFISFRGKQLLPGVTDNFSGGLTAYVVMVAKIQIPDMTTDDSCADRSYTTFGPSNDMNLFPSISAPGSSILSTVPGGLGIMRGTSMATPLVCKSLTPVHPLLRLPQLTHLA